MEDLNLLSNEELKYRLTQFGFANLPVTATTRKVLIKKLKNHMDTEKSKLRRETSYATRYSSDEDLSQSDNNKATATKKRAGLGRATIASISQPQSGRNSRGGLSRTGISSTTTSPITMPPPSPKRAQPPANWSPQSKATSVYVSPLIQSNTSDSNEESDGHIDSPHSSSFSSRYSANISNSGLSGRSSIGGTSFSSFNGAGDSGKLSAASSPSRFSAFGRGLRNRFYGSGTDEGDAIGQISKLHDPTNGVHNGTDPLAANDFTKRLMSFRNRNMGGDGGNSSGGIGPSISASTNTHLNAGSHTKFHYSQNRVAIRSFQYDNFILFSLLFAAKRFGRFAPPLGLPIRTPYLNDSGRSSNLTRDSIVYQASINASQSGLNAAAAVRKQPQPPSNSLLTNLINKLDEQYGVRQSFVPCALLSTLIIFFVIVFGFYLTMSPDLTQSLDARATTYKLCPRTNTKQFDDQLADESMRTVTCIDEVDLESAFDLLKMLIPELHKRAVQNRCRDVTSPPAMSASEIINFIVDDRPQSVYNTIHTLHNTEYLISQNPQWRIRHFADHFATGEITINEVKFLRDSRSNYLAIVHPSLPITCVLYNKMQAFFIIIGCLGIVLLFVYLIVYIYKAIMNRRRLHRERLNNMIEDITNILMQKAYDPDTAATEAASIVINHLRDKFIPPSERGRMESTWNEAIKFLEQNESRIQFSVATRNGEDYRVMRWIDTSMPTSQRQSSSLSVAAVAPQAPPQVYTNNSLYPRLPLGVGTASTGVAQATVKKWQSPAFDKTNKIKDPPTECLKVRQMFDKYEANNPNLKQIIQDAILEKLAHTTCRVYDIQLDKNTCCVYVRCATAPEAGIVHDEINGWWFDSRLVSIKFLRLDRFLNRFPQSITSTCLKPSNSKNLSMANCNDGQANGDDGNDDDDYYFNGRN